MGHNYAIEAILTALRKNNNYGVGSDLVRYLAEKRNPVTSNENIDPRLAGAERPPITMPAPPPTTPTSKNGKTITLA